MGNKCCSCLRDENNGFRGCFGCSSGSRRKNKSGGMVAADLHSSGANMQRRVQNRPSTLNVQSTAAESSSAAVTNEHAGSSMPCSKFSEFSLHGVQKTSPVGSSSMDSPGRSQEEKPVHKFSMKKATELFNRYKDPSSEDMILAEGVARFCEDLSVDPTEYIVLILAWKFKALTMCRFSREEFTQGCLSLQSDSIKSIKGSFHALELEAERSFKDLYKFTFQFGLDVEEGQRSLPCEIAVAMWNIVFSRSKPPLLNPWLEFLVESKARGISRDTWNMFLHFTENVGTDLSNYDDNEAWPSLFDDFVEYYSEKQKTLELEAEEERKREEEKILLELSKANALPANNIDTDKDDISEFVSEDVSSETSNSIELTPVHKISDSHNGTDGLEKNGASEYSSDPINQIESTVCPQSDYQSPQELNIPGTVSQNEVTDEPASSISGHEIKANDRNSSNSENHDAIASPSTENTNPVEISEGGQGGRDSEPVCCETLHSSHSL